MSVTQFFILMKVFPSRFHFNAGVIFSKRFITFTPDKNLRKKEKDKEYDKNSQKDEDNFSFQFSLLAAAVVTVNVNPIVSCYRGRGLFLFSAPNNWRTFY